MTGFYNHDTPPINKTEIRESETEIKRAAEVEPTKLHQNENSLRASSPFEKSAAPIFGSLLTRYFQLTLFFLYETGFL